MNSSLTIKKYILAIVGFLAFIGIGFLLKSMETTTHNNLQVVLTVKMAQDDMFQLFYEEIEKDGFSHKKTVDLKIKGKKEFQKITFIVPKLTNLNRLRLDIGNNKAQGPILIKDITFLLDRSKITYDVAGFNRLFRPNNYVNKIDDEGTFKGMSAIRKSKQIYDPYFSSRRTSKELIALKTQSITAYPFGVSMFVISVLYLFIYFNIERIIITKETIFIGVFFIILTLPVFQNIFELIDSGKNLEKRKLATKPEFNVSEKYPKQFETYLDDNFGFRNYLINWGGSYRTKLFRSSMHPELVKFGKEDWLFYNKIKGHIFKSYTNSNLLSNDSLRRVVNRWEKNKENYNKKGAKYFLAFWPNKHTIYPEYLPRTMNAQIKDTISRADQILEYLKQTSSPIKLLDSRTILTENKVNHQLYYKFDTHWNDYGAFLGYQNFFNENKDELGIDPKSIEDFNIEWTEFKKDGLIRMLGVVNNGYFFEKAPVFELKENKDQIEFLPIKGFPESTKITRNKYCGNNLKVLVFRDSFTSNMIQFFSLHFFEVTYIWGHGERYVDELKPDIIIEGYVERSTANKIQ
ncbi:alginate O-acetyltransferase AlgX-related protein [Maribacter sp. ACAM166]|uniref:alginate O-acetyltransferase AlgX-related protein n=1 Tax=Maribacter sp. ACAM166 TaxID=2508996 RepID=UPI0010FE9E87|nr:hypothetical protein [Maribacter sp. ACAM166]TLP80759.1 hypothetical protein ES765_06785 [Maribacter sp. ACAM166]